MILLIQEGKMFKSKVKQSIIAVFNSHEFSQIPLKLNPPQPAWSPVFSKLAEECGIKMTIKEAFQNLDSFYSKLKMF